MIAAGRLNQHTRFTVLTWLSDSKCIKTYFGAWKYRLVLSLSLYQVWQSTVVMSSLHCCLSMDKILE